jgi:aryl-alcohol dehydrogenase-like predicted oxidoreductase
MADAQRRGVGVLVKKGLASGRLPASEAIPFVLRTPGVTNLVIGGLSLAHLQDNVAIATRAARD